MDESVEREAIKRKAESTWRTNPAIQAEFNNNLAAFIAYETAIATGRARVFSPRTSAYSADSNQSSFTQPVTGQQDGPRPNMSLGQLLLLRGGPKNLNRRH